MKVGEGEEVVGGLTRPLQPEPRPAEDRQVSPNASADRTLQMDLDQW